LARSTFDRNDGFQPHGLREGDNIRGWQAKRDYVFGGVRGVVDTKYPNRSPRRPPSGNPLQKELEL
jgi:hypothetical protein